MTLKVWHLCSNRWHSAITEYAISAARALTMAGHTSRLAMLADSPGAKHAAALGVPIDVGDGVGLAQAAHWRGVAASFDPDVVITYGGPETALLKALPLKQSVKILRFRGQDAEGTGIFAKLKFLFGHGRVEAFLAPSQFAADRIRKLTNKPVHVIPLGIDAARFKPQASDVSRDIVILGRFDPIKGHERAMEIFRHMLNSEGVQPRLHIIGEPKNVSIADLEAVRTKLGLRPDQVKITAKRVPAIDEVLAGAALGWVPSLGSEVICRVAEEFLLCGTPIAVSGVGSLPEVVSPTDGVDYAGLGDDEAALLLRTWWELSRKEAAATKENRALRARARFSLESMGSMLVKILAR